MRKFLAFACVLCALIFPAVSGCKTPTLEKGGAYDTGNKLPDLAFYAADSAYDFAFSAIQGAFKYERDNRLALWKISPQIKHTLDGIRPTVWDINVRWAKARRAFLANPLPENLTALQTILAEIQRLVPIVQDAVKPAQP